ncbi:histidine kinase [Microbacterium aquilitoris]|uniref:histidine kinase n=1 Tax=Microbacterium aquilitoris TaxID=3067307 RepID=UPI0028903E08|nr:histidine kinase [Microbacterium sp. KSW2-22]MDT3344652.1 histidine kinase [Microbacterium sp. KSW2-22]
MRTTRIERIAAGWLALEALGILILLVWELVALLRGDSGSVGSSIALLVLTAVGAAALGAFAVAVWRDGSWGRSGGVVAQLLVLSIALGTLTGEGADTRLAATIAVPAIVGLVVLIAAARAAGRRGRDTPVDEV